MSREPVLPRYRLTSSSECVVNTCQHRGSPARPRNRTFPISALLLRVARALLPHAAAATGCKHLARARQRICVAGTCMNALADECRDCSVLAAKSATPLFAPHQFRFPIVFRVSMDTSNAMNFSSTNQTDAKLGISKTVCHGLPLPTNSINNQPDPKGRSGSGAQANGNGQSPSSRFA